MPDLKIQNKEDRLEIRHDPSLRSWLLFFSVIGCGLAAAYINEEHKLWQLAYAMVATTIAFLCFENWETCIFDKTKGTLHMGRLGLLEKIAASKGMLQTVLLADITNVDVLEEKVWVLGTGYTIMIVLSSGTTLPLTDQALLTERSHYDELANIIRTFLNLAETNNISDEDLETTDDNAAEIEKNIQDVEEDQVETPPLPASQPPKVVEESECIKETEETTRDVPAVPSTPEGSSEEEGFEKIDKAEALLTPKTKEEEEKESEALIQQSEKEP